MHLKSKAQAGIEHAAVAGPLPRRRGRAQASIEFAAAIGAALVILMAFQAGLAGMRSNSLEELEAAEARQKADTIANKVAVASASEAFNSSFTLSNFSDKTVEFNVTLTNSSVSIDWKDKSYTALMATNGVTANAVPGVSDQYYVLLPGEYAVSSSNGFVTLDYEN